jgi:hypothetical protein
VYGHRLLCSDSVDTTQLFEDNSSRPGWKRSGGGWAESLKFVWVRALAATLRDMNLVLGQGHPINGCCLHAAR